METDYGVTTVVSGLKDALSSYLQAQYHIRHQGMVRERAKLFSTPGVIAQQPYVEATPAYALGPRLQDLKIPEAARSLLAELAPLKVGVFPEPYKHQADALEAFLGAGKDVLAATGTGSGKTEIFLHNILGGLAVESADRPKSTNLVGCRALLLYPMNALVTDQLGRIRRLFGDSRVADRLHKKFNRRIRFGMYTSRTPYPGEASSEKARRHIVPLMDKFYLPLENDPNLASLKERLEEKGRWPKKDLKAFYNAGERLWENRLKTQPLDTELFTRHEIQGECPDILITNYSMLEYMMLRPIERSIFQSTKIWLDADPGNFLTLVLDEAHMYRGTGGAEVAMLIRRLMARLRITRDRLRCILTTASIGREEHAQQAGLKFAAELTGLRHGGKPGFQLITGKLEPLANKAPGTPSEAQTFAGFALADFQRYTDDQARAARAVQAIAPRLKWDPTVIQPEKLADWLFTALPKLPVINLLISETTDGAREFAQLATTVFPGVEQATAERATQALLSLANFAKSETKGKVLLPARLHLFFRGIQGIYACINPKCNCRLDNEVARSLGRLWTEPRESCECGARVFEMLTHRDCGTEYLRGFVPTKGRITYLFHEKESPVGTSEMETHARLREMQLLIGKSVHPRSAPTLPLWIDVMSGQVAWEAPSDPQNYLAARVTMPIPTDPGVPIAFGECPICLKSWQQNRSKIMDLKTKGEQPFAALVKAQMFLQPPTQKDKRAFPNQGRKVLLFSDGRQKAARLARNIPLEVEHDSFRESLVLAVKRLKAIGKEPKLADKRLYLGFIDVVHEFNLSYFDRSDHDRLMADVRKYRDTYNGDLRDAFEQWDQIQPPDRYHQALLRQLCGAYYSIPFVMAGWLAPGTIGNRMFQAAVAKDSLPLTPEQANDIAIAWLAEMASDYALGPYQPRTRQLAEGWPRDHWGTTGDFPKSLRVILEQARFSPAQVNQLNAHLLQVFAPRGAGGRHFVDCDQVTLHVDLKATWFDCPQCHNLHPVAPFNRCVSCNAEAPQVIDPNTNTYITSRKGLWREPLKACWDGTAQPRSVNAEEHTAQLSHRDAGTVLATTEQHELLFQDVIIDPRTESPVDVLSCTTTMEVGVDIGSLVAVGLRNVPPQRENYQQRAGRAGRRGSAISTVVTYCQGGPHDSHYFQHVARMVSGAPRSLIIKTDNEKIVRRHIHAYLLQTYFLGFTGKLTSVINSALGRTADFFSTPQGLPCFEEFRQWTEREVIVAPRPLVASIAAWLPEGVTNKPTELIVRVAKDFVQELRVAGEEFRTQERPATPEEAEEDELESKLLDFLFDRGMLPTYAFPTDLSSFNVEERPETLVRVKEKPQQSITKALTEYAPGRIVVIDKKNYRCEAVTANVSPFTIDRAAPLFQHKLQTYRFCSNRLCSFVQEGPGSTDAPLPACPLCASALAPGEILKPEVFLPFRGKAQDETDNEQEFTFASPAQFPIPLQQADEEWSKLGTNARKAFAPDRDLVVVNKGDPDTLAGFHVCTRCGIAKLDLGGGPLGSHKRPYDISYIPGRGNRPADTCSGDSRRVLLGSHFTSDLMVMRITAQSPLETNSDPGISAFMAMQHALRTLAEALSLAASRRLDLDPGEFSTGFRVYPTAPEKAELAGEIYLFDTLAGGAGYANQIGEQLLTVLREDVTELLSNCTCDRSCYSCLRHYANQYYHVQLDRHLALALLRYALDGVLPKMDDWDEQIRTLLPLERMLKNSGFTTQTNALLNKLRVPLLAEKAGRRLALATMHGLYAKQAEVDHPLLAKKPVDVEPQVINRFLLSRNLPGVHAKLLSGK